MKVSPLLIVALTFASLAPFTSAQVIWDNGEPNLFTQSASDFDSNFQGADNFTLATPQTAAQIQWWGAYGFGPTPTVIPDAFTIRFFAIVAGVPAIVPFFDYFAGDVGRVNTALILNGTELYSYSAAIPATLLPAGDYLLSIVNNTAADTDDTWVWASSKNPGTHYFRFPQNDTLPWAVSTSGESAFRINGPAAVPENGSSAFLLALALLGLCAAQRGYTS